MLGCLRDHLLQANGRGWSAKGLRRNLRHRLTRIALRVKEDDFRKQVIICQILSEERPSSFQVLTLYGQEYIDGMLIAESCPGRSGGPKLLGRIAF